MVFITKAFSFNSSFWPGLGLPSKGISYHAKNQLLPNHVRKRTSKSAKYGFATTLQKQTR